MKTIIAGSRQIRDGQAVLNAINESGFEITEVVSGKADGPDTLGVNWAWTRDIPYIEFPADWKKHGRAAGPIRNREMAQYADALIAVWDGESRGTADMIRCARKLGLKVHVYRPSGSDR